MTDAEVKRAIEEMAVEVGDRAVAAERLWDETSAEEAEHAADALREAEQKLLTLSGSKRMRR